MALGERTKVVLKPRHQCVGLIVVGTTTVLLLAIGVFAAVQGGADRVQVVQTESPAPEPPKDEATLPLGKAPVSDENGDLAGFVDEDRLSGRNGEPWPAVPSDRGPLGLHGLAVTDHDDTVVGFFTIEIGFISNEDLRDEDRLDARLERQRALEQRHQEDVDKMMAELEAQAER